MNITSTGNDISFQDIDPSISLKQEEKSNESWLSDSTKTYLIGTGVLAGLILFGSKPSSHLLHQFAATQTNIPMGNAWTNIHSDHSFSSSIGRALCVYWCMLTHSEAPISYCRIMCER